MDKTIDRWTDPDGNGYAFKDTVARAQNRATIDKMNAETADRKTEVNTERKRIDNLIATGTAQTQEIGKKIIQDSSISSSGIVLKGLTNNNYYYKLFEESGSIDSEFCTITNQQGKYTAKLLKPGLYYMNFKVHVEMSGGFSEEVIAPLKLFKSNTLDWSTFDVLDAETVEVSKTENTSINKKIHFLFKITEPSYIRIYIDIDTSHTKTITFRIDGCDIIALDWKGKQSADLSELHDLRIGADGVVHNTAGEAVRKQIGNLTEDLGNLSSSKISKFYATNNGENHLADSDDGKIADMMVYGKSEQKSTMGKNLLKLSEVDVHGATNGLLITMNADGSVSVTGTSTSSWSNIIKIDNKCHTDNATYTFSVDKNSDIVVGLKLGRTKLDDANYQTHRIMQNQLSCTFETGASNEYCSLFLEELTVGKSYNFTIYPMLELGTEATAYEPYTGGQPSPSPDYPQEIKSVVNPTIKLSNGDGTESQTVTLPYVLNAIPVNSGGNVTINGQQYVADYVDVERGKLTRMCKEKVFDGTEKWRSELSYMVADIPNFSYVDNNHKHMTYLLCNKYKVSTTIGGNDNLIFIRINGDGVVIKDTLHQSTVDDWKKYLNDNPCIVHCLSAIPEEIDLTTEEIIAFKSLVTCYPTTNISVNSEHLDGYTVFNYPISMQNGWNCVKQQLNDNRDYIYDMDTKTQDIDTQTAEAYVNSEYAVALTELEV